MDRSMHAAIKARLLAATQRLHDLWFDVAAVRYDSELHTVTVPFFKERPRNVTQPEQHAEIDCWLTIANVDDVHLEESEHVGLYDFNEFRYSPSSRILRIATGVPLTFDLSVSDIDLAISEEVAPPET